MRKGFAGLVLGLALVIASISWAGFIMSRTVLDPGRSERLAVQVFDNEELRSVLVTRLAESLGDALPGEVVVPSQTLELAASLALDNPEVQRLVRTAIVDTHKAALEGNAEPVVIDSSILSNALFDSLVQTNPNLETIVPVVPSTSVELPTSGLNFLGSIKGFADRVTLLAALAALAGGSIALMVTSDRPSVLRRVSFWAFGAALFWLIVGFGVPLLAGLIGPTSSAVTTAAVDVFFGAMITPAMVMAGVGVGLAVTSVAWASAATRHPARVAQPARASRGPGAKNTATRLGVASATPPVEAYGRPVPRGSVDQTVVQSRPIADDGTPAARPGPGATRVSHEPSFEQPRAEPIWIEGRGYVDPDEASL